MKDEPTQVPTGLTILGRRGLTPRSDWSVTRRVVGVAKPLKKRAQATTGEAGAARTVQGQTPITTKLIEAKPIKANALDEEKV